MAEAVLAYARSKDLSGSVVDRFLTTLVRHTGTHWLAVHPYAAIALTTTAGAARLPVS
jgi:hypothetical protein